MPAETGKPNDVVMSVSGTPIELQPCSPDTILAVCGRCGFEWSADHKVEANGAPEYECARCTCWAIIEARDATITAEVQRLLEESSKGLAAKVTMLTAEVEHLRPQNALVKEDAKAYHAALVATLFRSNDDGFIRCQSCVDLTNIEEAASIYGNLDTATGEQHRREYEHNDKCILARPAPL